MNLSPVHIWHTMSVLNKVIACCLLGMALLSLAVAIERVIALIRSAGQSARFSTLAGPLLDKRELARLVAVAKEHPASSLARTVAATVGTYVDNESDDGLSPVERAKREAARQLELASAQLRRGLGVLASVGSVAPFVGLLGTVVGIIAAFQGIAATGSGGLGAVSAGIAEALVETALGLMVAIPAVLIFNALSAKMTGLEGTLGRSLGELVDDLESHHGRITGRAPVVTSKSGETLDIGEAAAAE
jgi:biopolymer transport protein ExbB